MCYLEFQKNYYAFTAICNEKPKCDIISGDYNTSFTVTSKADFEPKMYYTFPLKLATFAANKEKYGYQTTLRAQITKFWFEVEDNEGKLLDNQLVWNDSDNPQFNDVTKHDAVISGSNISLMIVLIRLVGGRRR